MTQANKPKVSGLMNTPLYALANEYTALMDDIHDVASENEGIVPEEMDTVWDAIQADVTTKLDNTCVVMRAGGEHVAALKAEETRLRDRRKSIENGMAWVREYVTRQMVRMGVQRSDGPRFKIRTQLNNPACDVTDLDSVPPEHCMVTVTMEEADWLKVLAAAARAGEPVGEYVSARSVKRAEVVKLWKECAGAEDVPGTRVIQTNSIRIW